MPSPKPCSKSTVPLTPKYLQRSPVSALTAIKRPSGVLVYTRRGHSVFAVTVATGVAPANVGCSNGCVESK